MYRDELDTVSKVSSLVVFSIDVQRLAAFYQIVLGAKPLKEPSETSASSMIVTKS